MELSALFPHTLTETSKTSPHQNAVKKSAPRVVKSQEPTQAQNKETSIKYTPVVVESCAELGGLFGYSSTLFATVKTSSKSQPAASVSKKTKRSNRENIQNEVKVSQTQLTPSVEKAILDLEKLGQVIRSKKAEKKDFKAELVELKTLKRDYAAKIEQYVKDHIDDPTFDITKAINLLPQKKKKQYEKLLKTKKAKVKQAEITQFDAKLYTDTVRTQRKIFHLLDSIGDSSTENFKYCTRLNPSLKFKENEEVFLTEKWDGTTVQATKNGVFKRRDLLQKGDPQKHGSCEAERYSLDRLNLQNPQYKHIAQACPIVTCSKTVYSNCATQAIEPYLETFKQLDDGVCIYFEAFGPAICGSAPRFRDLKEGGIRVFDSARNKQFLPFEETLRLASKLELPVVHSFKCNLVLDHLLKYLQGGEALRYTSCDAPLEGYVVRSVANSAAVIAKIRLSDLNSLVAPRVPELRSIKTSNRNIDRRVFGVKSSRSKQIRAAMARIMAKRQLKKLIQNPGHP